ncbi:MAG: PQQ-dependent sugar dehydrogenase [Planctomycetaceae bacterium]
MTTRKAGRRSVGWAFVLGLVALLTPGFAADQDSGHEVRVPWTTSRITGSPDPPLPFTTERVFPQLTFTRCLDIAAPRGSERLFVAEQDGKIFSFPNRPDVEQADLVADLAKEIEGLQSVYAITFHPDFERNRYCYVCYIKAANLEDGTHIARFKVADTDPPTINVETEQTIITWLSGGHNGCCLKFGPDGYLYISTGDGAGPNPPDIEQAGQDVSNLLSSILRIDVDSTDGMQNYRIPSDNPFVNLEGARGEIWAYGLRNPWRMSFDSQTGDLWVGDVGWELWEMLDRIERGGNYGWAVMEGNQSTNPEWPRGPTPILPPTIDHPHSESSSITDGLTYYGSRLPELHGHHLYGDYDTGKIWGFRFVDGQVVDHRELADTTHRIVGFGADHEGECYLLDHTAGTIHRLVPNAAQEQNSTFPRTLSESGLFTAVKEQIPAPGVIPYSINAEPWADYAVAERFVAVPGEGQIKVEGPKWSFPKDTVLVKTLSLDLEQGNPDSRRRIETQILHFDGAEWKPYTYRWNEDQTDAALLDDAGAEEVIEVIDPDAPGGIRQQSWRYSGRGECQRCHNNWSGPVLAFDASQLNRTLDYGGTLASQLDTYTHIGLIESESAGSEVTPLANPHDEQADLNSRARAYLHVNCGHCHRMHAGSSVLSYMHADLPLEQTNMVGARPTQGTFGIHDAKVVAAGDPFRSVLLYRMSKLGGGRMPHIGSTEVDREGVALIEQWIQQVPVESDKDSVEQQTTLNMQFDERTTLASLQDSMGLAERTKLVNQLLSSTSGALRLLRSIESEELSDETTTIALASGTEHESITVRDLFERFLPPDKRIKRLGTVVHPEQILSLTGDPERGKQLFMTAAGVACKNCHRIGQDGKEVGPDLSAIGKKLDRLLLLESILEPSKRIDPKYVSYLAETKAGLVLTGLLVEKTEKEIVLKDAQQKLIHLAPDQIEQLVPQRQSLMPELLFRDLTAQQVADLVEYLSLLK